MNKSELIEEFSKDRDLPVRTATAIVKTILEAMTDSLMKGEGVDLRGFGHITVREYAAHIGRNPKTGIAIPIGPKKMPFFKPSKIF
ncbi:MAG: integration host factor subunit beta [Gammaproteobacteria bacterium]|nr:integration host factor subunit beta [Gammaproteobacteria bacterium]MDR3665694.1 integration host factor subunit beta [Ignavibacteriaceae bacterium]